MQVTCSPQLVPSTLLQASLTLFPLMEHLPTVFNPFSLGRRTSFSDVDSELNQLEGRAWRQSLALGLSLEALVSS